MLQRGADVNAVSNNGAKDRPVDVAKKHGATDAAIALLEPGPTGNGQRPLHVVSLSLFFHDEGDDVQQEATRLGVMQQLPLAKVFLREEDALWATTPSSTDVHELYAALATTQQRLTSLSTHGIRARVRQTLFRSKKSCATNCSTCWSNPV